MFRSRRPGRHVSDKSTTTDNVEPERSPKHSMPRKRRCHRLRRTMLFVFCFIVYFLVGLSSRLSENLSVSSPKLLRGGGSTLQNSTCPELPKRLQNVQPAYLEPLSKEEMEYQMQNFMDANEFGTTGNKIFICRQHDVRFCRGVVKIYRSKAMYYQVKRCLSLLRDAGITSRILYTDDEKAIMVEEDMGLLTMMNSPIPLDYVSQLQRIQCLLSEYSIIHRDYNFRNFVVNQDTGRIMIIDFGDAVVWQGGFWNAENYNLRNIENVSTLND